MDYLKRLRSRLRELQRPDALGQAGLGTIPLEILQQIIEHLPDSSAAAFSICCIQIKRLVGDQYLEHLAGSPSSTADFLSLVAVDLPSQIACASCQRLHKIKNAARYTSRDTFRSPTSACYLGDLAAEVPELISAHFSSTIFQMTMKRYQQGSQCTQLLNLLSYHTSTQRKDGYSKKSRADCRIIRGLLAHRLQYVFLQDALSISSFTIDPRLEICRHISFISNKSGVHIKIITISDYHLHRSGDKVVWSLRRNLNLQRGDGVSSGMITCPYCCTEFQIDFKRDLKRRIAMFFTRWKLLGAGPDDEIWKQNFKDQIRVRQGTVQLQGRPLSSVFEENEDFRFDSLLLSKENKNFNGFKSQTLPILYS
ncbi:hypothetical protein OIDMADRAFT_51625 [Oidiodendron maius Zn]|uniref:F-box domain-containing protein n=1 Tax=Oidiodendron maius (strain Zn) TaxID=913774 RepID=A0A0C3H695_OIDMZ|nr:hypothetical protein OIDMADRAFT_51625 [Oidiodendron maius Zn]